MRLGRVVVILVGCCLPIVGCGDDSDGDGGSNGEEQGVDWSSVNPPPNIDITSCFGITDDESDELGSACSDCCQTAGYSVSSSINDAHCTCGEAADDGRDTVCAGEASKPTFDPCRSCCTSAGFSGYRWVGREQALGAGDAHCSCYGKSNSAICAAAFDHAVPEEACPYCCLENGYLRSGYTNFGAQECLCTAP